MFICSCSSFIKAKSKQVLLRSSKAEGMLEKGVRVNDGKRKKKSRELKGRGIKELSLTIMSLSRELESKKIS